jgi:ribonuclease P protein component
LDQKYELYAGYRLGVYAFKKTDRIRKRPEFVFISKSGKKIQNRQFIIVYSPSRFNQSRIGITVTKRIGKAVRRNRIKRLVREYYRHNRHRLKGFWDINVIAKNEAAELNSKQIFLSLEDLFETLTV